MAQAPAIPQDFSLQQANGQVLVSWSAVAGTGTLGTPLLYNIQRSTDNYTWVQVQAPFTPFWLDTTVSPNTLYYYRVQCSNGLAVSPFTNSLSIVPTTSGAMTLGQVRLAAQQRADLVNSTFVTTQEWNSYITQSYFELYDLLVQKYGNDYFVAPITQFLTTSASLYPLPDGVTSFLDASGTPFIAKPFYKLLGVDLSLNAGNNAYITLHRFNFMDRNNYVYPQLTANALGVSGMRYRLLGNNLEFIPTPTAGQLIRLFYVPRLAVPLQDTDLLDGVSGWTEYVIVDAAIKAMQKEESDVSVLAAQKMALIQRIEAAAENRDAGEPSTITNVRRSYDQYDGWGFDGPNGGR